MQLTALSALSALSALADDELLSSLARLVADGHRIEAAIVAYLGEVEERRLYLERASPSMFDFCRDKLRMSSSEAYRRMRVAKLGRRFPALLEALAEGRLHLSAILLLHDLLTPENVGQLIAAASGKTKREVAVLVAELAPKPDVASSIRLCPEQAALMPRPGQSSTSSVAPLSSERYEVRFTAGKSLEEKLERARALLRHQVPDGNLPAVFEKALDALLEKLEKQRLGKTSRPQTNPRPSTKAEYITRAVRREVARRDQEQCTFVSAEGERCPGRAHLEFDHIVARARGGSGEADNIRLRCRAHNFHAAEQAFGRAYVAERIRARRARSEREAHSERPARQGDEHDERARAAITGALVTLGFKPPEARRAVAAMPSDGWHRQHPDLLRDALAVLSAMK